ncbi:hypothetical protein QWJ26_07105 [Streptomyces sp. CSDS2]|uniref:hypothetical protein n=1 Tax=Streptomyces sp. CSDS2 TaxID=3055051 RepID=UPI0025B23597|nr:hypothetical protein [Streptomyces sp. CSDS2]MDN3259585.1 hypothetical protein [Streptomyces sp. CSDS2]
MEVHIMGERAPALGDIRGLGQGDTLWLEPEVWNRRDWGRYVDAVAHAVCRGADARWARG